MSSLTTTPRSREINEPPIIRFLLTVLALALIALFLVLPLAVVYSEAFKHGKTVYLQVLRDPDSISAILLTLKIAAVAVPLNLVFGVAASWLITKFDFFGKNFLLTLIDLPFAVSPVIAGMVFVFLFGQRGYFGPFLERHHIQIVFAWPAMVLATVFVTFPFVARELIPLMTAQGRDEEQAAVVLGASGWQMFRRVTVPNIRWALLYGIILCNARAMGEFGAVSVVSGHIAGNVTIPLQVQMYSESGASNAFTSTFALASVLTFLGLITLIVKKMIEWKVGLRAEI